MDIVSNKIFHNKKIIIFGCGYIGTSFAMRAMSLGAQVTALTHNSIQAQKLKGQGVETVVAELRETGWHTQLVGKFDFALNCVGSSSRDIKGYQESYLEGMRSIMVWSRSNAIGTFLYTSSTSVYPQNHGELVDELASKDGIREEARILLDTEKVLMDEVVSYGNISRYFILRLSGIYGPTRHYLLDQIRSGEVSTSLDCYLNIIHQEDVVSAIEACFAASAKQESAIYNCSDNHPALKRDVIEWVCKLYSIQLPKMNADASSKRKLGALNRKICSQRLINVIGWKPRYSSYKEGYKAIIESL